MLTCDFSAADVPRPLVHTHTAGEGSTDAADDSSQGWRRRPVQTRPCPTRHDCRWTPCSTMPHETRPQMNAIMCHLPKTSKEEKKNDKRRTTTTPTAKQTTTKANWPSAPSMIKRTHDDARPPLQTTSTTATRHAPYQNPRPHPGLENADVGPSLSHVFPNCTKSLPRTYVYDFVCDVTRFTHLVTSQGLALMIWRSGMVLAAPGPLLTPPPSSSPSRTPIWSYSEQTCMLLFFITTGPITKVCALVGGG